MRRHHASLVAVCAIWATVPVVVRQSGLTAPVVAFGRLALAAVLLGALLAVRGEPLAGRPPRRAIAAGAILGVHWLAIFAAYQRAAVGTVILITYVAPVVIAAIAPRALDEHLDRRGVVALALGFAGLVLVAAPALGGTDAVGAMLAGAAALTFAALIVVSKPVAADIGGLRLAFVEMAVGAVVVLPTAVAADWSGPGDRFAWLGLLAVLHTAVAMALYLSALAHVPATEVGTLTYLEPALALVAAWAFLAERPTVAMAAGGALILAAGTLVATRRTPVAVPEVTRVPR